MTNRFELTTEEKDVLPTGDKILFGILGLLPEKDLQEIVDPELRQRIKAWEV